MSLSFGMTGGNRKMPDLLDSYLGYTFFVKGDGVSEPVHVHVAKGHGKSFTIYQEKQRAFTGTLGYAL